MRNQTPLPSKWLLRTLTLALSLCLFGGMAWAQDVDTPSEAAPDEAAGAEAPSDAESPAEEAEPAIEEVATTGQTAHESGGLAGVGIVIGLKAGAGFSQVFSELGTSVAGELELGYLLPLPEPVGRDIELFVTGAYAGPSQAETINGNDERLPGDGSWSYELTLQQIVLGFGILYRIPVPVDWVRPYVAAGGRGYFTRTEVSGNSDGNSFGSNEETDTVWGGFGTLGADFFVGPGSILFEVNAGAAPMDNFILRDTNTGALTVAIGYRIFI